MRPQFASLALAFLLLGTFTARGQAAGSEPRAVADSFFRLLATERFRDAAQLMDLEAFEAERRQQVEFAEHPEPPRTISVADLLRADPKMPRVVAEYQVKRMNASRMEMAPFYQHEFGVSTLDSLRSLPVADLAAHWLEARDMRTMLRRSLVSQRARGCVLPADSLGKLVDRVRMSPARILGAVRQDSMAWILFERPELLDGFTDMPGGHADSASASLPGSSPPRDWQVMSPSILFARRVGDRWRLVPTADSWSGMAYFDGCAGSAGTGRPRGVRMR